MKKRYFQWLLMVAVVAFANVGVWAQNVVLKNYYANANGRKAAELKTAMYGIITNHTNIGYDGLLTAYAQSDRRPDGYLRDWYSNATSYTIGGRAETASYSKEGDSYNREHSVPQSWFSKANPMKSDLVHVIPTDGYVNNRRGSYPFGETKGEVYQSANGYSKLGACTVSGYSGQVFEPNDEIKGDIARIYFYMITCYQDRIANWNGGTASQVFDGKTYPGLKSWTLNMMLRWARQDPVDDVERARNEVVYKLQKNRNPFVDYPSLCEFVWGDSISYAFDVALPHGQKQTDNPDNPDNPDKPDNPDNPDNPATSGSIILKDLSWTAATDATYGAGYTASSNDLTFSYYKAKSTVAPVEVNKYGELRFYDKSVLLISGAELTQVVFYASDKVGDFLIDGKTYSFADGKLTWTGNTSSLLITASGQSRIQSIDITVLAPDGLSSPGAEPSFRLYFDGEGRRLGSRRPRGGLVLVREGATTRKMILR